MLLTCDVKHILQYFCLYKSILIENLFSQVTAFIFFIIERNKRNLVRNLDFNFAHCRIKMCNREKKKLQLKKNFLNTKLIFI